MILHMKCCHYAFYNFLIIISVSLQIVIQEFYMRNPLIEGKFFLPKMVVYMKRSDFCGLCSNFTLCRLLSPNKRGIGVIF